VENILINNVSSLPNREEIIDFADIYGHLYNEMQDEAATLIDDLTTTVRVSLRNPAESHAPSLLRLSG